MIVKLIVNGKTLSNLSAENLFSSFDKCFYRSIFYLRIGGTLQMALLSSFNGIIH